MSKFLIQQYYSEVQKIIQYGGSRKETTTRVAFQNLLNEYCKTKNFVLIPELEYKTSKGNTVYPDGTVKDALRLAWGYWESKDEYDNIFDEIQKKIKKGYPTSNILFEDSQAAVLIQGGSEKMRVTMDDDSELDRILHAFIEYERPEIRDFRLAIEKFKEDLPTIIDTLRSMIYNEGKTNKEFQKVRDSFLKFCQESINPLVTIDDVREMLIQHILTEEIFLSIFSEGHFHRENNVAKEIQKVEDTFFTGSVRRNTLFSIENYYLTIKARASEITNHHEKQKFLKVIYENFYKAYNPKAADRLGIVYTPSEIVHFMIETTDYLLHKHFGKLLADKGVEILVKRDNITDWGLEQFREYYSLVNEGKGITKQDIFHYVYAILHNPSYRKKYELNLKRELPRIPFYKDFFQWVKWGNHLMDLHLSYETAKPYELTINGVIEKLANHTNQSEEEEVVPKSKKKVEVKPLEEKYTVDYPKTKLKADKENGKIYLDEITTLEDIPPEAWEYKLGNRSALEWILDQYREKKSSDPVIEEKFNDYKFGDYKEEVIDLIRRVCTVSVETVKIVKGMKE
ncbi:MAG: hypothetical protein H7A23_21130 [Leptospiraceae bacterium]|nr:hypothetical protein [Leptospiraceae bacterium]MCP5497067.1 hypothetical protein [Leptospiraceae bacterium]